MNASKEQYSLLELLPPERQPGEAFDVYRNRRRICATALKVYLRGRVMHSTTYNAGRNADKRRRRQLGLRWRKGQPA